MESQRVLIVKVSITEVAGFPPLPQLQQEVLAIGRNHQSTELGEPVRRRDILRAILDNPEPFDIIHFAGHLCEQGFVASEEIIPLEMIVMYIQTGQPQLVFFNTCSSEKVAEMVASRCPSDCIFTISDIDNQDAIDFSVMFYSVLRAHDIASYKDARDRVDSSGTHFRYLMGKNVPVRRGDEYTQRIDALERAVGGDRLGSIGLAQRMTMVESHIASMQSWIAEEARPALARLYRSNSLDGEKGGNRALMWAIFVVAIVITVLLAIVLLRVTSG